jgi:hypothetical protein
MIGTNHCIRGTKGFRFAYLVCKKGTKVVEFETKCLDRVKKVSYTLGSFAEREIRE